MDMGFTEIKELVNWIINWLKDFFLAVEQMLVGITPNFPGYTPVLYEDEE